MFRVLFVFVLCFGGVLGVDAARRELLGVNRMSKMLFILCVPCIHM